MNPREAFPTFSIATAKNAWVAEVWETEGERVVWNLEFTKQLYD